MALEVPVIQMQDYVRDYVMNALNALDGVATASVILYSDTLVAFKFDKSNCPLTVIEVMKVPIGLLPIAVTLVKAAETTTTYIVTFF